MLQRFLNRIFRNFIKGDAVYLFTRFFQVQRLGQMPGNRLTLTVGVRCEIYFFRFFHFLTQIGKDISFTAYGNVFRFVIVFNINSHTALGQVPDMSVAGRHFVIGRCV